MMRLVAAYDMLGQTDNARTMARNAWRTVEFTVEEEENFLAQYQSGLQSSDHIARLDRLLWEKEFGAADRMMRFVPAGWQAVARAREALLNDTSNASAALQQVPQNLQGDPGLLHARTQWLRQRNRDREAIQLLQHPAANKGNPEEWWKERHILIRRMLEMGDKKTAYALAKNHGQVEGLSLATATFLEGWLALRGLNQPEAAKSAFAQLYDQVTMPVSRARGAYWLGRAHAAAGDSATARAWYQTAAAFYTTYYGQLAKATMDPKGVLNVRDPTISDSARQQLAGSDTPKILRQLIQIGRDDLAEQYMEAAVEKSTSSAEVAYLADIIRQTKRADLMVKTGKAAAARGVILSASGFPIMDRPLPSAPEKALIHAIVRQESLFQRDAVSSAGARGYMQLMPATAKQVAKQLGIKKFRTSDLSDPQINLRLGSAYLDKRIDDLGSLPLAIASYNAGIGNVRDWLETLGDPRQGSIDMIDWIEMIPVAETRNYVQRVLENLQVYRARLAGGQAPLRVLHDLK